MLHWARLILLSALVSFVAGCGYSPGKTVGRVQGTDQRVQVSWYQAWGAADRIGEIGSVLGTLAIEIDGEVFEGEVIGSERYRKKYTYKTYDAASGRYEEKDYVRGYHSEAVLVSPSGSRLQCHTVLTDQTGFTNSGFSGNCEHRDGRSIKF